MLQHAQPQVWASLRNQAQLLGGQIGVGEGCSVVTLLHPQSITRRKVVPVGRRTRLALLLGRVPGTPHTAPARRAMSGPQVGRAVRGSRGLRPAARHQRVAKAMVVSVKSAAAIAPSCTQIGGVAPTAMGTGSRKVWP